MFWITFAISIAIPYYSISENLKKHKSSQIPHLLDIVPAVVFKHSPLEGWIKEQAAGSSTQEFLIQHI